jgi:hypothetical protein
MRTNGTEGLQTNGRGMPRTGKALRRGPEYGENDDMQRRIEGFLRSREVALNRARKDVVE